MPAKPQRLAQEGQSQELAVVDLDRAALVRIDHQLERSGRIARHARHDPVTGAVAAHKNQQVVRVADEPVPPSLQYFRRRLRELTGRNWGVPMDDRCKKLAEYGCGWMGYFGISDYYRPIPKLDHWLRRWVRMCYWKQWRGVRNRIRHLLALGTP